MMGLAADGGLLVPHHIPDLSKQLADWKDLSYPQLAYEVMSRFIDDINEVKLRAIIDKSYSTFDHPLVTPLIPVGDDHVLELFHGPTLAFKDVALQFLGNVFDHILKDQHEHLNILGATSGDTGSAAISGVKGRTNIDIYIMYPEGKTSAVQERQMITVLDKNVHNIAIQGSFDDCQNILKTLFNDAEFKSTYKLGAVNSVNWARILAQVVYYFSAWYQLQCPKEFEVSVPTGNFGNIFAGFLARKMGLPVSNLLLATNCNDILARFFASGIYERGEVSYSHSPAMDIQVSSNLERYLYYYFDQSPEKVRNFMETFARTGKSQEEFNTPTLDGLIKASSASDQDTLDTIAKVYAESGYLLDPHTAVGMSVAQKLKSGRIPLVILATAHPAKFSEVIESAVDDVEVIHPTLSDLENLPVRKTILPADVASVKKFISEESAV